ncbi:MAG TPA: hypothetical protein VI197_09385 [Polyangiaceae bacterium]
MIDTITMISSNPGAAAVRCRNEDRLIPLVKTSLLVMLSGTGAFGLVLGGTRDWTQALATLAKLPLVWVVTLAVSAPAFYAIAAVLGQPLRLRALSALTLVATARASLVLLALLPVLALVPDILSGSFVGSSRMHPDVYHKVTLLSAVIFAASGLAALGVLLRGFQRAPSTWPLLGLFTLTFFFVAGQTAWSLRPFVGRPAQHEVPLLRTPEGTFLEAVATGYDSARGRYDACQSEYGCE